ncbi:YtxH domain-containing protein [Macrococcus bovicus]|uniref:YtxH domain-containing protein n=1 Tax=Macrococcus bovicus TaxID=69968 RepID=A0A4R6C060_9STAP|nr:YtxH domain-containing protein [Macrococcus bovicus]TDM14369.1 YtxH domain-containing protein [Macrococcus bovicus]
MKITHIAAGFTVGLAAGAATALLNAAKPGSEVQRNFMANSTDAKAQVKQLKTEIGDLKNYAMQTKEESQKLIKELGTEVKEMIANYKSDIEPNIKHLKSNVENVKNRADEAKETFSKK